MTSDNEARIKTIFEEGLRLLKVKAYASAYEKFAAVVREDPKYSGAYVGLGLSLERSGSSMDAIPMYKKAIRCDPENAVAIYNLGVVYLGLKQHFKAWRQFKKTLKLQPDNPNALHNLGLLAFNKKKYKKAVAYLLRAAAVGNDKSYAIHYLIGKSFLALKSPDEAFFHFRKSQEYRDDFLPVLFELFKLHQERSEWLQLFGIVKNISRLCSDNQVIRNEIKKSLKVVKDKVDTFGGDAGKDIRQVLEEIEAELEPEQHRPKEKTLQPKVLISEPEEGTPRVYH